MMSMMLVVVMTLLPWTLGTSMLYALLWEPRTWLSAEHLILIGAGAYLGYVTVAGLLFGLLHCELSPFSWLLPVAWLAVLGVCLVLGRWRHYHGRAHWAIAPPSVPLFNSGGVPNVLMLMAGLWLASLATWIMWEVWHNPLMAWDAVREWGVQANQQLTVALGDTPSMTVGGTHPATSVMISMWSAYSSHLSDHAILGFGPWGVLYLGTLLVTLGLMLALTGNRLLATAVTGMVMSAPMIESHAALGGYADLWVLGGLVAGVGVLIGVCSERKTPILWLTAVALILSVTAFKNNSMVLSAIVLLSMASAVLLTSQRAWLGYLVPVGILVGLASVLKWGVSVEIGPLNVVYSPETGTVRLGNRVSTLAQVTWAEIGQNLWHAWWMASSYGVVFSAALIVLPVATLVALVKKHQAGILLSISACGLISFLALAQFTEYFLPAAQPAFDTGLSRASHSVYWFSALSAIVMMSNIKTAPSWEMVHHRKNGELATPKKLEGP